MASSGLVQRIVASGNMGRPFVINLRSGGQRCATVQMVTDHFGTHPGFRFVCDSMCNLTAKRPSKRCRLGGGTLSIPQSFQGGGGGLPAIQFVR